MKHPIKHLGFPEAAVETIAEFRQIVGQIFSTGAVMDAPATAFDILQSKGTNRLYNFNIYSFILILFQDTVAKVYSFFSP